MTEISLWFMMAALLCIAVDTTHIAKSLAEISDHLNHENKSQDS